MLEASNKQRGQGPFGIMRKKTGGKVEMWGEGCKENNILEQERKVNTLGLQVRRRGGEKLFITYPGDRAKTHEEFS